MSGGHYDYLYWKIEEFSRMLKDDIRRNDEEDDYGYSYNISPEVLSILEIIADKAEILAKIAREVEWMYSGDIDEEELMKRIEKILDDHKES